MCLQKQRIPRLAIALIVALLLLSFGCATLYKKVSQTPPLTTKDTFYLAGRCASTFKIDTIYAPGDFIYVTTDSTGYWQGIIDSIKHQNLMVTSNDSIIYKDTCRSAVDRYKAGVIAGYGTGFANGKLESGKQYKTISRKADSVFISQINKLKQYYNTELKKESTSKELALQEAEKYRTKSERKSTFIMWLLIALLISATTNILQARKIKIPFISK